MSLYKARQEIFQKGFLSLLVLNKVFFPASAFQISYLKILLWQLNKMVTDHKTYQLGRPPSNHHYCQIWFTGYGENVI